MPDHFDPAVFRRRLKHLRIVVTKLSTQEFAARANVSPGTINHYETARCSPSACVVFNICKSFGVSADWLLGLTEE